MSSILTPAALAMYMLELLKEFWQKVVAKDETYEFPPKVIAALLVLFNFAATVVLALLGLEGYELPTDWTLALKTLLLAILSAVVSSTLYVTGLKPFKAYVKEHKAEEAREAKAARKAKK